MSKVSYILLDRRTGVLRNSLPFRAQFNRVVGEYKLTSDMATVEITVDVANCERLAFWLDHNRNSPSYGIFDATLTK